MSQEPDLFSSEKIANAILAFIGVILGGVIVAFIVGEGRFAGVDPTRNQWIAMIAGIPFLVVIALMINRRQRLLELLKMWGRRIRNNWQLIAGVVLFLVAVCGAFALTWSPWSTILVVALTSSNVLFVTIPVNEFALIRLSAHSALIQRRSVFSRASFDKLR